MSTLATGPGSHPITALADTQLYDLFQSQWPHLERSSSDGRSERPWFFQPPAIPGQGRMPGRRSGRGSRICRCTQPLAGVSFQDPISFAYTKPGQSLRARCFFNRDSHIAWVTGGTEINGFGLDRKLAAQHSHTDSGQPGVWEGVELQRANSGHVDLRRMDGIPAICGHYTHVHGSLRSELRVSGICARTLDRSATS